MSSPQESSGASSTIDALLQETRRFPPSPEFTANANVRDPSVYQRAHDDPEGFWAEAANRLDWFQRWDKVLEWDAPWANWFVGGKINASYNAVDRHNKTWRRNKAAIIWEGEPGDSRVLTYHDLYREVNEFAAVLLDLGVTKGDRVAFYMPMIPELSIGLLACARIGAPHTVIFGGFSAEALRDRAIDSQAKVIVTADGGWRRGNIVPLKDIADAAAAEAPTVEKILVVRRLGSSVREVNMHEDRDVWYHEAVARASRRIVEPEALDSEHPLYIMYTSGTTGKPKGQMHTTAGYLVGTSLTHEWIFDLKEDDIYWCTADIGWVTGHSYIVYGPLTNGATVVMYEGAPDYPDKDRFWEIVEKYAVSILYTAPTSIRTFMRWGDQYPRSHDLSSLRLLGTVGEPINPEAWIWYNTHIGHERCPIVDTWWQTETGMIMITPLPGITTTKPGSATMPFPGVEADILDENGNSVPPNSGGNLVIKRPWPAMSRRIWGDPDRYVRTYWERYPGMYLTGDGARRDEEGYYWLLGRVDDVLNVSGHRIGTMEVESALVSHPAVAEAAVIGATDPITGQAIVAFVTPRGGYAPNDALTADLREHVAKAIGALARPKKIYFTTELPKTRSAKIMRRLLRDIAEGRVLGDTTTLLDPHIVSQIKDQYESTEG
ncbi:MAG TPA: acetate--CoA ligase [Ktedonobacterales bacterium]|jgi:acetyl-CoA synthetase|nr:acetate--CoA ligase [Ktedonobacterales bacterium]